MDIVFKLVFVLLLGMHITALKIWGQTQRSTLNMQQQGLPESPRDSVRKCMIGTLPILFSGLAVPFVANAVGVANSNASPLSKGYLTEPTDEFKREQELTAGLKKKEAEVKSGWEALVAKFQASETPEEILAAIKGMREYLVKIDNIPPGFKKLPMVKMCRLKKFSDKKQRRTQPNWTTPVEIEYQAFIKEVNGQLSPDKPTKEILF